jgi:glucose/arabinose dehydrogenase
MRRGGTGWRRAAPWHIAGGGRLMRTVLLLPMMLVGLACATNAFSSAKDEQAQSPAEPLFERTCLACHDKAMIFGAVKSKADWQATVERMIALGATATPREAGLIVDFLHRTHGIAVPPAGASPDEAGSPPSDHVHAPLLEGQPVEVRPGELPTARPAFSGQTRAPYHRTHGVKVTTISTGLDNPWSIAFLPGGDFLITEKPGALRIVTADGVIKPPVKGTPRVFYKTQAGLLDVVLDRDFGRNRRIFFSYMDAAGADTAWIRIASAILDRQANALRDVKIIFTALPAVTTAQPGNAGGRLAIARDGTLFATIGDRVSARSAGWNKAQELDKHLGKIIHIDANGKAPAKNPFLRRKGALPEIWSFGHRSQQGLAFSPSGQLWETEHGPRGGDELNRIRPGGNYGWPLVAYGVEYRGELIQGGRTARAGTEQPAYYWDPVIAPSGFAFYDGALFPQWRGSVLIGGLRGERLTRLRLSSAGKVVNEEPLLLDLRKRIRDVRVGPDGAVYLLTDEAGASLLRLTPAS